MVRLLRARGTVHSTTSAFGVECLHQSWSVPGQIAKILPTSGHPDRRTSQHSPIGRFGRPFGEAALTWLIGFFVLNHARDVTATVVAVAVCLAVSVVLSLILQVWRRAVVV